jgi:uncharacterized protein (DUF305 family)
MNSTHLPRTVRFTAVGLAALAALSGCASPGDDYPRTTPSPTAAVVVQAHNTADEQFVAMMIAHHEQALAMAEAVLSSEDVDPEVVSLATDIKAAQTPEIATMMGWLDAWGVPYNERESTGDMMGDDHGMMDDGAMDDLAGGETTDAGTAFLKGMIAHHEGAVAMATTIIAEGESATVTQLAEKIIADQTAEIAIMEQMLSERDSASELDG